MAENRYTLRDSKGRLYNVLVQRDKRLKKTVRWHVQGDSQLLVRVPVRFPSGRLDEVLQQVAASLEASVQRKPRASDDDLLKRARLLNRTCFDGKVGFRSIRWVGNMKTRLGSCTNGGTTDGDIRISREVQVFPQWVVDYVICHELAHRLHPNHSKTYWATLRKAYPCTDEARAFIQGYFFARGMDWVEE